MVLYLRSRGVHLTNPNMTVTRRKKELPGPGVAVGGLGNRGLSEEAMAMEGARVAPLGVAGIPFERW